MSSSVDKFSGFQNLFCISLTKYQIVRDNVSSISSAIHSFTSGNIVVDNIRMYYKNKNILYFCFYAEKLNDKVLYSSVSYTQTHVSSHNTNSLIPASNAILLQIVQYGLPA